MDSSESCAGRDSAVLGWRERDALEIVALRRMRRSGDGCT